MEKNEIEIANTHVVEDIRNIITKARSKAYQSINAALIRSNWEIGKRISNWASNVPTMASN